MKLAFVKLFILLILISCETEKLDERLAQSRVEALLKDISNNKYHGIEKHFTLQFNRSEPVDQKIEKYQQLKRVLGPLQKMELQSSRSQANFGEEAKILLQYRITYRNAVTNENFEVVKDEGEYRIASHHIKPD